MNKKEYDNLLNHIIKEVKTTRDDGHKEYARTDKDVLANFNRISELADLPKEKVLMVYLYKHIDGIASYVNGYKSQREDVRGRIKDVIVYLTLLWAMIEDKIALQIPSVFKKTTKYNSKTGEVTYLTDDEMFEDLGFKNDQDAMGTTNDS